jgi:hypothetical protein
MKGDWDREGRKRRREREGEKGKVVKQKVGKGKREKVDRKGVGGN